MEIPSEIHIYHHFDIITQERKEKGRIIPLDDAAMDALIRRTPYVGGWRTKEELKNFMKKNHLRFYQTEE